MNEVEWERQVAGDPLDVPTRLAYADWLEERGMAASAAAQRVLAGAHTTVDRDGWDVKRENVPRNVWETVVSVYGDAFVKRVSGQDQSPSPVTSIKSTSRSVLEKVILQAVVELLVNGREL